MTEIMDKEKMYPRLLPEQFLMELSGLGITLEETQQEQFLTYYRLLVEKNKVMNLTAITEFEDVLKKHFLDSLMLEKAISLSKEASLIDVGTGAGFPGIPLKIVHPHLETCLLDSLNKRVKFLQETTQELGLSGIQAIHSRAEEGGHRKDLREKFDVCVSRAVSDLSVLSEYCLPFVKVGGVFVAYKSGSCDQEVESAGKAIHLLGGKLKQLVRFSLPDSDMERALVVITKEKPTPGKYPRKAGTPQKEPLRK